MLATKNKLLLASILCLSSFPVFYLETAYAQGLTEYGGLNAATGSGAAGLNNKGLSNSLQKSYNSAGNALKGTNKVTNSEPMLHRRKGKVSPEESQAAGLESNKFFRLAQQKEKAGKLDEAKQLYYKAAVARADVWGHYDPAVANISMKIGQIELKQKHPNAARTWYKQSLTALSKRFGSGDYELVPALLPLAKLEANEKNHETACNYYEHILLLEERKFGEDNAKCIATRISYAQELLADKDFSEAEKIVNKAIEIDKKTPDPTGQTAPKLQQLLSNIQSTRASNSSK